MPDDLKKALSEFIQFAQTLRGDEKGEFKGAVKRACHRAAF
jgi:hypothetical protein